MPLNNKQYERVGDRFITINDPHIMLITVLSYRYLEITRTYPDGTSKSYTGYAISHKHVHPFTRTRRLYNARP